MVWAAASPLTLVSTLASSEEGLTGTGERCVCWGAAVNHMISKATLKKATRVIREQRRRQRRGPQAQAQEEDAILDV